MQEVRAKIAAEDDELLARWLPNGPGGAAGARAHTQSLGNLPRPDALLTTMTVTAGPTKVSLRPLEKSAGQRLDALMHGQQLDNMVHLPEPDARRKRPFQPAVLANVAVGNGAAGADASHPLLTLGSNVVAKAAFNAKPAMQLAWRMFVAWLMRWNCA